MRELTFKSNHSEVHIESILALRSKFLGFLSARLSDRHSAEDILQSAYVSAIQHHHEIRAGESAVAWFYRILRNALIDHYRRTKVRDKGDSEYAAETPLTYETELAQTACVCVGDVIRDLKSEYRAAIERVDLGGHSVEDFAKASDFTPEQRLSSVTPCQKVCRKRIDCRLRLLCRAQTPRLHLQAEPTVRYCRPMRQQQ